MGNVDVLNQLGLCMELLFANGTFERRIRLFYDVLGVNRCDILVIVGNVPHKTCSVSKYRVTVRTVVRSISGMHQMMLPERGSVPEVLTAELTGRSGQLLVDIPIVIQKIVVRSVCFVTFHALECLLGRFLLLWDLMIGSMLTVFMIQQTVVVFEAHRTVATLQGSISFIVKSEMSIVGSNQFE